MEQEARIRQSYQQAVAVVTSPNRTVDAQKVANIKSMEKMSSRIGDWLDKILSSLKIPLERRPFTLRYTNVLGTLAVFIWVVAACMSAPIEATTVATDTTDPSARATEIANEVIGSFNDVEIPTLEAKPTSAELTSTPEKTATSEVEAPIQDGEHLDFGLNSQDFEKPDSLVLPDLVIDQEVQIVPRSDGSEARLFFCVASELHVGRIQLTENVFSLAGSICWYQEDGKNQWVYVPHVVSDEKKTVLSGYEAKNYDSRYLEATAKFYESFFSDVGYEGKGHIFTISAEEIIPKFGEYGSLQGVGAEELSKVFTDEIMAEFIRTMDPEVIGHMLIVAEAPFGNTANLNK